MSRLAELTDSDFFALQLADFARYVGCLLLNKGDEYAAADQFVSRWPHSPHRGIVERAMRTRSAITVGGPTLLPNELNLAFVNYSMPFSLVGRLAARRAPFGTRVIFGAQRMGGNWVGAGLPKPTQAGALDAVVLPPAKVVGVIVTTSELDRLSAPGSTDFLRDELRIGHTAFLDNQLLNPAIAAVPDVSPASLTYGLSAIPSSGSSAADALDDFRRLLAAFIAGGGKMEHASFILSSENSAALALTGERAFQDLTISGGLLGGVPVLASSSVGDIVALVDANGVLVADDRQLEISSSNSATLEMLDAALQQNARAGTGSHLVSLWQSNLLGLKAERFINWQARAGAVAYVDGAQYYAVASPA